LDIFKGVNLNDIFQNFIGYVGFDSPLSIIRAVVDIGIVTYAIYKLVILAKETRAWQLIKGLMFIFLSYWISSLLGLRTIAYLLNNTVSIIAFAIVVIFQPELRRGLERIGRSRFRDLFIPDVEENKLQTTAVIEEIVKACTTMSENFVGALIIIEKKTKVGEIIKTGVQLDSVVSSELLLNIFTPNTPLHDGAVIIRDNKIKAAGCFLPLSDNPNISKELGTRHRAALGISEVSDCVAVIVSEESGKISVALNGGLTRNLTPDILRKALTKNLVDKDATNKKITLWKVKTR